MKKHCPICGKEVSNPSKDKERAVKIIKFFPFCSQRCKLVDLNVWLSSEYIISTPLQKGKKDKPEKSENMLK
jgi:endogenous inhibitor of DNA gyrase (YacG/DUF329 family)